MDTHRALIATIVVAAALAPAPVASAAPSPLVPPRPAAAPAPPAASLPVHGAPTTPLDRRPAPTFRTATGSGIWVEGGSPADQKLTAWAVERFDTARLVLPDIELTFHPDDTSCRGHAGLRWGGGARDRIAICARAPMTVLHELAHSWGAALPDDRRNGFMELRNLDTWNDPDARWRERASEHQAHIVAWGLLEEPIRLMALPDNDPDQLAAAFTLLTGIAPLHQDGEAAEPPTDTGDEEPPAQSREDEVQIHGATRDQEATITAAIDRYQSAGLDLPGLTIQVHRETAGCRGAPGVFDVDGSGTRIDLCTDDGFIILHELAHAWEHHAMTAATRRAFLAHTGLEVWNHADVDWAERGIELAANAIAWGLIDTELSPGEIAGYAEHLDRFELLTGIPSPRLPGPEAQHG